MSTRQKLTRIPPENLDFSEEFIYHFPIQETKGYWSEGCLMSKKDWLESVESHLFIDYDGHGDPCFFDRETGEWRFHPGGSIKPSWAEHFPEDATHILWYNR